MIIELIEFKLIEGISEESFLKALNKAQVRFFNIQTGFIRRDLLKTKDDTWINIFYWKSIENAQKAAKEFTEHSSCLPFVQMVSPISMKITYLDQIKTYKSKTLTENNNKAI